MLLLAKPMRTYAQGTLLGAWQQRRPSLTSTRPPPGTRLYLHPTSFETYANLCAGHTPSGLAAAPTKAYLNTTSPRERVETNAKYMTKPKPTQPSLVGYSF